MPREIAHAVPRQKVITNDRSERASSRRERRNNHDLSHRRRTWKLPTREVSSCVGRLSSIGNGSFSYALRNRLADAHCTKPVGLNRYPTHGSVTRNRGFDGLDSSFLRSCPMKTRRYSDWSSDALPH